MRNNYRKTLWGSIIAFVLGTGCCWVSSLAIWIGGAAIIAVIPKYLPNLQLVLLTLSVILALITLYLYFKK